MITRLLFAAVATAGCSVEIVGTDDAMEEPDALPPGIAPPDVLPEASPAVDGDNPIAVGAGAEQILRVDVAVGEHVAFELRFPARTAGVRMHVDRWDGAAVVPLQLTDAGPGLRVLAVTDPSGPRTFWVRVDAEEELAGATLTITRTPFEEGPTCADDCARLMQLPLPNDPAVDGYAVDGSVFRYQFGRRDLVMFIRAAGRRVAADGMQPFHVADLSQWDGATPGTDTGNLRHVSHQRGKDVDISLYGDDGAAPFRSYCTTVNDGGGRECVPGSMDGYDGDANAIMFGSFFASGRVTMCFLDAELIPYTADGASRQVESGGLAAELLPLYSDGTHLQHWPNHDNHIHVRVSEAEDAARAAPAPFEAP